MGRTRKESDHAPRVTLDGRPCVAQYGDPAWLSMGAPGWLSLSFAKTPSGRRVVDLSALIRRRSKLDDHPPAPPLAARPVLLCGGHRQIALENLALHQQLAVYKRSVTRPKLRTTDRLFWVGLARVWAGWRHPLVIVTPDTVLRWQRRRFRQHWTRLSGRPTVGWPAVNAEIKALVIRMAAANPLLYSIRPES